LVAKNRVYGGVPKPYPFQILFRLPTTNKSIVDSPQLAAPEQSFYPEFPFCIPTRATSYVQPPPHAIARRVFGVGSFQGRLISLKSVLEQSDRGEVTKQIKESEEAMQGEMWASYPYAIASNHNHLEASAQ